MDKKYIDLCISIRERYYNKEVKKLYYRCIDKKIYTRYNKSTYWY